MNIRISALLLACCLFFVCSISTRATSVAGEPESTNCRSLPFDSVAAGQSVGLVLSGGGAKGIAHIGVIQALEDNDIPIDYVAGTSMGAIVGGLYAAGYTPDEMMALILSRDFANWSTGQIDRNLTYYFIKRPQTPAFANVDINISKKDSTDRSSSLMPSSLISPLPMNFAFMDLFAGYTAQCGGDFDRLFVPFRCVASDVINKHKVVCRSGMLSDAIRASMSFPAVFEPIKIDGVELYDGGIYDNFPVDVMRDEFAPGIMIGVDVHAENSQPSNDIVNQLENMIIQNNDYSLPDDEGIRIHVDVGRFSLLDFGKAREIYTIGYNRAMEMMDSIKGRVSSRIPALTRRLRREVFKSATPYVRFDSVHVSGGTPAQNDYLSRLFMPAKADTFGIADARMAYYRAITPGKLRNLFPQAVYSPESGLFTLDLDADMKNNFSLGAGGYLTSSINSMIFVSASYSSLSFRSTEAAVMGWIGQSYMAAELIGRLYLATSRPSALDIEAVYARQKYYENDKLFYEDNSPAFISHYDAFARLNYGWAIGRSGRASIGAGGGQIRDKFYSNEYGNFRDSGRERTVSNLGQAIGRLEFNTLDSRSFSEAGYMARLTAMYVIGKYHHCEFAAGREAVRTDMNTNWFQVELQGENYFPIGKRFVFGTIYDVLVSNRELLNTYYASSVNAPEFSPTPSTRGVFNKAFRANSFIAAGVVPIWKPFDRAQVRLTADVFLPFRRIEEATDGSRRAVHGQWFRNPEFMGEIDVVYNLPFASICGYVNYLSYPARNWNIGISFGLYLTASRFLR